MHIIALGRKRQIVLTLLVENSNSIVGGLEMVIDKVHSPTAGSELNF